MTRILSYVEKAIGALEYADDRAPVDSCVLFDGVPLHSARSGSDESE